MLLLRTKSSINFRYNALPKHLIDLQKYRLGSRDEKNIPTTVYELWNHRVFGPRKDDRILYSDFHEKTNVTKLSTARCQDENFVQCYFNDIAKQNGGSARSNAAERIKIRGTLR